MRELIGKRVLIVQPPESTIYEVFILSVSPSGRYVKLDFSPNGGGISWREVNSIKVVEVLE